MRIQHNISAMNAYRNYNNNTKSLSKNLEKLSSGYRINRAGDDAAGLAISEKMRAQITGLNAASKNVKDGISLVQTAEGAMQEVHDMLGRMKYLATQSSNGTYQNEVDRENLQKEVDSLLEEIDRIADSSNFNGQKLLDGSLGGGNGKVVLGGNIGSTKAAATKGSFSFKLSTTAASVGGFNSSTGAKVGQEFTANIGLEDGRMISVKLRASTGATGSDATTLYDKDGKAVFTAKGSEIKGSEVMSALVSELKKTSLSKDFDISLDATNGEIKFTNLKAGSDAPQIGSIGLVDSEAPSVAGTFASEKGKSEARLVADASITRFTGSNFDESVFSINGKKFIVAASGGLSGANFTLGADVTVLNEAGNQAENLALISEKAGVKATIDGNQLRIEGDKGEGLKLQIGDTSDKFNQMNVNVADLHTQALGLKGLDISNADSAGAAIQVIQDAINSVSSTRGDLGALQNRLEHTSNNLSVMTENIQDAEATIRDTDVADEMMKYTKNNILVQSAQAMLAQANQLPQGVLQLLQ